MNDHRVTIFPETSHSLPRSAKRSLSGRKFQDGKGIVELTLSKTTSDAKRLKTQSTISEEIQTIQLVTPKIQDPELLYSSIYTVNPAQAQPYCLAQEKESYRVLMIKRSKVEGVFYLPHPIPNILNLVSAIEFNASLFTVYDRPGVPLASLALCSGFGFEEIKTISREAIRGLSSVTELGIIVPILDAHDITVSAIDGRVKVDIYQAVLSTREDQESCNALPYAKMLTSIVDNLDESTEIRDRIAEFIQQASCTTYQELQRYEFLTDAKPTRFLTSLAINAQLSVYPEPYVIRGRINELHNTRSRNE